MTKEEEKKLQLIEAKKKLLIAHAQEANKYYKRRFYEFNQKVLEWPDIYEPLHKKVCDFVQQNIKHKKLLILLPRGTFKSSIITIGYPLWRIAQNPASRGLIANATYDMAKSFLSQIKDNLSKNEKYRRFYGDMTTNAPTWREDSFKVNHKVSYSKKENTMTAVGLGTNYTGTHFDYAILDDLVNRDNIRTKERIEEVVNFYKDSLDLVDVNEYGHKEVIVIGTTWHQDDLYARIQDTKGGFFSDFEVLRMPAFEGVWGEGKLLFPPRLGWQQLEELKRQQGSAHFSAQYLLDPVPLEDAAFRAEFKYYEQSDIRGLPLNKYIALDPALTEKKESDYSAMVCVGVDKNNVWYVLDLWRDKVNPKRLLDQMFYWDKKHSPVCFGIETTAFQRTLQFFAYEEMKKRNHFVPIKDLTHTDRTKEERILRLEPRYETGTIFHNKQLINNEFLEDELRRFPRGRNDDFIDALSSIAEFATPPRVKSARVKRKVAARYPA